MLLIRYQECKKNKLHAIKVLLTKCTWPQTKILIKALKKRWNFSNQLLLRWIDMFSDFTAISKKVSLKADLSNLDLENSISTIILKIIVFPCLNQDNLILVFHKEKFSREKELLDLTELEKISLSKTLSSVKT